MRVIKTSCRVRASLRSPPQRTLGHQTPIQSLQIQQEKRPDLFIKRVHKQTGLDTLYLGSHYGRRRTLAKRNPPAWGFPDNRLDQRTGVAMKRLQAMKLP